MKDYLNEQAPFFYIEDLRDKSKWAVVKIDDNIENRLGWLNCKCIEVGSDTNGYVGSDMGIDAGFVFMSGNFDFSKELASL